MKFRICLMGLILLVMGFGMAQPGHAQGVKERMKERLPVIADLKARGVIGESHDGYLAFVGKQKENQDVVSSENKDRKAVYTKMAQQQKTTLDLVEKRAGANLAKRAKPGEFVQKPGGEWIKK